MAQTENIGTTAGLRHLAPEHADKDAIMVSRAQVTANVKQCLLQLACAKPEAKQGVNLAG